VLGDFSLCQNRAGIYPQRTGKDGLLWQQHVRASERDSRGARVSDPTDQIEAGSVSWELLESIAIFPDWLGSRVAGLAETLERWCLRYSIFKQSPYGGSVPACSANLSTRCTQYLARQGHGRSALGQPRLPRLETHLSYIQTPEQAARREPRKVDQCSVQNGTVPGKKLSGFSGTQPL
jgi:hypothetical protein